MKVFPALIFSFLFLGQLLPHSANAQWYQKQYGADSISDLTEDQYNSALQNADRNLNAAKRLAKVGLGMTVGGAGLAGVGFLVLMDGMTVERFKGQFDVGIGAIFGGIIISQLGIIPLLVAAPLKIIGSKRKSDIEMIFGKSLSAYSISPTLNWHQSSFVVGTQITIPLFQ
jgi:hypothetical protein